MSGSEGVESPVRTVLLKNQWVEMLVDVELGGRIVAFSLNGQNALTTSGPQVGSTYWPSPQSSWGWPPLKTLDSEPYNIDTQSESEIVLVSAVCAQSQLQLKKVFSLRGEGVRVTYVLKNTASVPVDYAPWEISRVDGGLTIFESEASLLENSTLLPPYTSGCYWHDYAPAGEEQNLKLFANSSTGWIANANQGLLFLKTFPRIAVESIAPEEAEVEIYAHGDPENPYIEIEQQGAYSQIAPGAELAWSVDWYLSSIPSSVGVGMGSESLLALIKEML